MNLKPDNNDPIYVKTWYDDNKIESVPSTSVLKSQSCEVLIVGGGLAGLCLLQNLLEKGIDALLVEANEIGQSASGRNGGFCTPGWALSDQKISDLVGTDAAEKLNQFSIEGYQWMERRFVSEDYESVGAKKGVLSVSLSGNPTNMEQEDSRLLLKDELQKHLKTEKYKFGYLNNEGYQFNPLNFLECLKSEILKTNKRIFTRSKVLSVETLKDYSIIKVNNNSISIKAKKLVFATGGYGGHETGKISKTILPIQTYIAVTSPLASYQREIINCDWAIYDTRRAGNYYRILSDNRLLWGHSITAIGTRSINKIKQNALKDIVSVFPSLLWNASKDVELKIDYAWSGSMAYTSHMMPYIGQMKPNVYSLVGFGGHGMNTAPIAANILSDGLTGSSEKLKVFERIPFAWNGGVFGPIAAELKYLYLKLIDKIS